MGGRRTTGERRPRRASWTPASILARASEVLREEGLMSLWFKVLGETVYRRLVVTELLLPPSVLPTVSSAPQAESRFLTADDLGEFAALHGEADKAKVRFARGDRCFGTWLDGRLAATRWLASGAGHIEPLGRTVALAPNEAYIYGIYTAPDLRRRGISQLASVALPAALAAEGVARIVGVLDPENEPGPHANERAGYRIVGRIGYVKLGPWRRNFGSLR